MVPLLLVTLLFLVTLVEAQRASAEAYEYLRIVQEDRVWWFQDSSGHCVWASAMGTRVIGQKPLSLLRNVSPAGSTGSWAL